MRGACAEVFPRWATAMMNSRCTSRPSLSAVRSGWSTGVGKGCRGGTMAGLGLCPADVAVRLLSVVVGLRMYVFICDTAWP